MSQRLEHEIDCTCQECFDEFLSGRTYLKDPKALKEELRANKLLELAEQEGGLKQYITSLLESLPNYNKICDCTRKRLAYDEDLGDNKHRDVCLRCGGILILRRLKEAM